MAKANAMSQSSRLCAPCGISVANKSFVIWLESQVLQSKGTYPKAYPPQSASSRQSLGV